MQERRNSTATALELSLSCTNLLIWNRSELIVFFREVYQVLIYMYNTCKEVEKVPPNTGIWVNRLHYNKYTITHKPGPHFTNIFSIAIQIRCITSFHSDLKSNTVIATTFCTWHDSCAVVACAKTCCDLMARKGIGSKANFPSNLNCVQHR